MEPATDIFDPTLVQALTDKLPPKAIELAIEAPDIVLADANELKDTTEPNNADARTDRELPKFAAPRTEAARTSLQASSPDTDIV
jgi:hypothetical protein